MLLLAFGFLLTLGGVSPGVTPGMTRDNLKRLAVNMTTSEISAILGPPSKVMEVPKLGRVATWEGRASYEGQCFIITVRIGLDPQGRALAYTFDSTWTPSLWDKIEMWCLWKGWCGNEVPVLCYPFP
jgi:hypothetical protein